MPSNTPTAFVSYSRADSEFALQLVKDLKSAGANIWLDQLDIEPGTPWDSAIEDALIASTHMLVVLSTISVTSDNVRDEISYALSQQMKIIPVLYQECKVPFRLARLQHIDFRSDYSVALKSLLKALRVEQQTTQSSAQSSEEKATLAEATERQRKEEERIQVQHGERLVQQARAEAERPRATAALAEQARRQEQAAKQQTSGDTPPPSSLGRIAIYALVAGLLRAIWSFASGFLLQMFSGRISILATDILTGIVAGLILCYVLHRFKPEIARQQLRTIFGVWVAVGVALGALSLAPLWLSPIGIVLVVLPAAIAGIITGRILSLALQGAHSNGVVIGLVAFAIPVLAGQVLMRMLRPTLAVTVETYGIATLLIAFFVPAIEVGLLLWFIRDWGQTRSESFTRS